MDESALERYFDTYIANEHKEKEEEDNEDTHNKDFFDLLPDELLMFYKPSQDDTALDQRTTANMYFNPPANLMTPETYRAQLIPQIHNIISSVKLGCTLDLHFIARNMWNVVYNPKSFNGLILKFRKPKSTVTIFRTGVAICSGTKSVEESRLAVRRCARKIQKLDFPISLRQFKIRNIFASTRALPVQLEKLMLSHKEDCSYEPELFPCLFYKGIPGVSVSIAHNGGIAVVGTKSLDSINEVLDKIAKILINFTRS